MRSDMHKVLVERPRIHSLWTNTKGRTRVNTCTELAPTREPMSRGRGSKVLNENLAPLVAFLRRRVGRRWDKIHSEICAQLRPSSAVQQHVLDHLADMVAVRVIREDGKLLEYGRYGVRELGGRWRRYSFYVCPESRRLMLMPPYPRIVTPPRRDRVLVDECTQLHKIEGVWYRVGLAPRPSSVFDLAMLHDAVLGRLGLRLGSRGGLDAALRFAYGTDRRYGATKKQLSKRELRALPPGFA